MAPAAGRLGAGIAANGQIGAPGMMGNRSATRNVEERAKRQWNPDDPWETAEGVAPVIEAELVVRIDPGPGILGMNR